MRKFLQSGKIWTILSALIFVMACGLVVYAATLSTSSSFSSWKSSKIGNTLTATGWDVLMDKLEGMDSTVQGLSNLDSIPNGAIVAFNLSSCPAGWSEYPIANGRFLMGASSNIGDMGGNENNKIYLTRGQIPNHSHLYKDTVFSESDIRYGDSGIKDYLNVGFNGEFGTEGNFQIVGTNSADGDNYPIWGYRKTNSQICDTTKPGVFLKVGEGTNERGYDDGCNYALGGPNSVDIANAYVKVKYCVKGAAARVKINIQCGKGGSVTDGYQRAQGIDVRAVKGSSITVDGTTLHIGDVDVRWIRDTEGYVFDSWELRGCGRAGNYKVQDGCAISLWSKQG